MKSDLFAVFLLFIFIFQPPFVPVALIYILGPLFFLVLMWNKNMKLKQYIAIQSEIRGLWYFFLGMGVYLFFVNIVDIFIASDKELELARARSFNQLLVLPGFQFLLVLYFLFFAVKKKYTIDDIFRLMVMAACVEGVCALIAYISPAMRFLFVTYGQQKLFTNEFFISRRGFGFAQNLIDTFGFSIGLLAGYITLYDWPQKTNRIFLAIAVVLLLFTTAINSRTGLLVFILALAVRFLYEKSLVFFFLKLIFLLFFGGWAVFYIQKIIGIGLNSDNETVLWISSAFDELMHAFSNDGTRNIEDMSFVSNVITLPTNQFEFLFGSGHWVYDTYGQLGLRTDIGWYNLAWEFGIIGTLILMCGITYYLFLPFLLTKRKSIQMISIFNVIAYYVVLVKAILLGSNPGSFVIYFTTFSLCYYLKQENNKDKIYGTRNRAK